VRDATERLRDVLEAIADIERYAARGHRAFEDDELVQSWIVRHLQVIGEAARALSQEVRDRIPGVPWSKIIGTRHILVHEYFSADTEVVWDVVTRDLPGLRRAIEGALRTLEEGSR